MVNFIQVNAHNSKLAMTELANEINKYAQYIAIIQEPYLNQYKLIKKHPSNAKVFAFHTSPRTCIFTSRNLSFMKVDSLCDKFTTTIAGTINSQKIYWG